MASFNGFYVWVLLLGFMYFMFHVMGFITELYINDVITHYLQAKKYVIFKILIIRYNIVFIICNSIGR